MAPSDVYKFVQMIEPNRKSRYRNNRRPAIDHINIGFQPLVTLSFTEMRLMHFEINTFIVHRLLIDVRGSKNFSL